MKQNEQLKSMIGRTKLPYRLIHSYSLKTSLKPPCFMNLVPEDAYNSSMWSSSPTNLNTVISVGITDYGQSLVCPILYDDSVSITDGD